MRLAPHARKPIPRGANKRGQPSKLTAETIAKISELVRAGNFVTTAAAAAGVATPTVHQWLRVGAALRQRMEIGKTGHPTAHEKRCAELSVEIEKASAQAEAIDVIAVGKGAEGVSAIVDANGVVIRRAMDPDWRAAAWRLEKRNRTRWGNKVEIEGTIGVIDTSTEQGREWLNARVDKLAADMGVQLGDDEAGEG